MQEKTKIEIVDKDIVKEYDRQKEYLEKCVQVLKVKLDTDTAKHKAENMKSMQTNMALIKEIAEYRIQIKNAKLIASADKASGNKETKKVPNPAKPVKNSKSTPLSEEARRIIQQQRQEINDLKAVLSNLQNKKKNNNPNLDHSLSKEKFPPMDGITPRKE